MPQRPFVPPRTPKTTRPAVTASEFRLARPFVPGSERAIVRPIEDFLDKTPAAAASQRQVVSDNSYSTEFEEVFELPPVEHFIDALPAVDRFAPDAEGAVSGEGRTPTTDLAATGIHAPAPDQTEPGWVETDWQHYDWRAAAALGASAKEASNAWAATDWDGKAAPARESQPTGANAIAKALDEIAQRIRDGKLAVPGTGATTDPATIAATLAALLGVKR